jgi:branched-chain amino acid transport system ATP-binding protein
MPPLLELHDISKSFGGLRILNRLSFTLNEGEALGVLGPNGAGKTTTLNVIAGELTPSEGRVFFNGQDVTRVPAHQRCHLGIARTYQIPRPFTGMTVYENVLVGARYNHRHSEHDAENLCRTLLERTGLMERRDVIAGNLRLLDRKRLELARALATEPQLLLLDEIGGGLTEHELHDLLAVIRDLRAQHITLIWIEHIVHALASAVDRILALHFGGKLAEGVPQDIIASKEFQEIYIGVE